MSDKEVEEMTPTDYKVLKRGTADSDIVYQHFLFLIIFIDLKEREYSSVNPKIG